MTETRAHTPYGTLIEPASLKIERLLPGPIERVWGFLTDGELRRRWLAAGEMTLQPGAGFTLVWRNSELTDPPGRRPDGFGDEHRMESRIVAVDPPRRLVFTWGNSGDVSFELDPQGDQVLLTVIHRRLPDRNMMLMVGAGWHAHLDLLVDRVRGLTPTQPFWDAWLALKDDYDRLLPR